MQDNSIEFIALMKHFGWRQSRSKNDFLRFQRPGRGKKGLGGYCSIYVPDKNIFICYSTSTPFEEGKQYSGEDVLQVLTENKEFDYKAGCRCLVCKTPLGKNVGRDKRHYILRKRETETAGTIEFTNPLCDNCFDNHTQNL